MKIDDRRTLMFIYAAKGLVAALTAGLHFHQRIVSRNQFMVSSIWFISLLHVGPEPLDPVDNLDEHEMHLNSYQLSEEAACQFFALLRK